MKSPDIVICLPSWLNRISKNLFRTPSFCQGQPVSLMRGSFLAKDRSLPKFKERSRANGDYL